MNALLLFVIFYTCRRRTVNHYYSKSSDHELGCEQTDSGVKAKHGSLSFVSWGAFQFNVLITVALSRERCTGT